MCRWPSLLARPTVFLIFRVHCGVHGPRIDFEAAEVRAAGYLMRAGLKGSSIEPDYRGSCFELLLNIERVASMSKLS